jgi:alkanesulfonate monooxygenase SsuD/methylene tetrahydromethanopterin reductase-like flavin-dependent oxidoreductase (luciferase family)
MKFGAMIAPRISDWQILPYAESLGYDRGWVPDSQMIWSDCYAVLALAAQHTSSIELGTGVAIAPTRIAPVVASSIASINRIAPGRVFLGIGTGHTAMRVMGFDPMPPTRFREYLRVVRALLNGEEVDYTYRGKTKSIKYLHEELGFFDFAHRIPIYVAADGPKALAAAGAYGDGRISASNEPLDRLKANMEIMKQGAAEVGRELPNNFNRSTLTYACVLEPGEKLTSDRVIDEVGSMVTAVLHYWYEWYVKTGNAEVVPDFAQNEWDAYLEYVKQMETPEEKRYQQVHLGHCTFMVPAERRFVTENTIRAAGGYVGEPDRIIHDIREHEKTGLNEVALLPPMAHARKNFKDFAEKVIAKY